MGVFDKLVALKSKSRRMVIPLIDPDRYNPDVITRFVDRGHIPPIILVGGSIVSANTEDVVASIKGIVGSSSDVILFPGDYSQIARSADALLFLSLVSGRNPEYLIGQQVKAAPVLKRVGVEIISVAYMLIEGGRTTSVQYVSNTMPIPGDKPDLAVATAIASEMLGFKMLYLEAGSGACKAVSSDLISAVRSAVSLPIIVGGGIRSVDASNAAFEAGADFVVVGTVIEKSPEIADVFW